MTPDQLLAEAETMHQQGASLEVIMQYLRQQGAGIIGTIWAIKLLLSGASLADTKDTVLNSTAWEDQKKGFWQRQALMDEELNGFDE